MKKVAILNEDYVHIGVVELSEEEVSHFSATGSAAARVCLDANQIAKLGIDENDYVYVRTLD